MEARLSLNYKKINFLWQTLTLFISPILITVLVYLFPEMNLYKWLLLLHLPLLMLHEAEEYVLSPSGFKEFFNLRTPFGSGDNPDFPLDEGYIFQVNVAIAYPVIILGAILANIAPWIGFSMIWFNLILNGLTHTIIFQIKNRGYNPGLITNVFVLLPYCTVVFIAALGFFTWYDWALSILLGTTLAATLASKTRRRLAKAEPIKTN